jgi:hypothetical protein
MKIETSQRVFQIKRDHSRNVQTEIQGQNFRKSKTKFRHFLDLLPARSTTFDNGMSITCFF